MERMRYLDGLRGLSCLMVVLGHFLVTFYPSAVAGDPRSMHTMFDVFMASTPFNFIYNGDFAVCVFFVLSGYVLSYPYLVKRDNEIIVSSAIRRLPRLLIPVVVSILFAYLLLKLGLYHNVEVSKLTDSGWFSAFYNFAPSFNEVLKSFYSVFFNGGTPYNVVLWTMRYELFGSFLIFSFVLLFGKVTNKWILFLICAVIFWDKYYMAFLTGLILSDLHANGRLESSILNHRLFKFVVLLAGVFFGSFPLMESEGMLGNTMYSVLKLKFLHVNYYVFYHIVGATLIVLGILLSKRLKILLSLKWVKFLGDISFSVYLIHFPILCSFSSIIYLYNFNHLNYHVNFLVTIISSLVIIILLSTLMCKYIDNLGIKVSRSIYYNFFKKNSTAIESTMSVRS